MDATRVTLVHRMTYRGLPEEWATVYYLTGPHPTSAPGWTTLSDALIAAEKACYGPDIVVVRVYGHDSDDPKAANVFQRDMSGAPVAGTGAFNLGQGSPGDAAVWVRWRTSRASIKGRPIYLRKFFHGAVANVVNGQTHADTILPAQRTALLAFGAKMRDGTFAEARTVTAPGHVDTLTAHDASSFIGYRQLRKGRKRPPTD